MTHFRLTLIAASIVLLSACGKQQATDSAPAASESAASAAAAAPGTAKHAYFGDLHVHTSMSFDAFIMGTNTLPEDAYRFARGEAVNYLGQQIQRKAPLDFISVTDHAEYLGVARTAADPNGPFKGTDWPRDLTDRNRIWQSVYKLASRNFNPKAPIIEEFRTEELQRSNWQRQIEWAEQYNQPGKLTTFVGYEWGSIPNAANLHRNLIFAGGKYPDKPFSAIDSLHPEDLWQYMDHQREQGVEVLAVSHNSNVSDGLMFDWRDSFGNPITREYADARTRNEPLAEIVQIKGQSETHPLLSANDELANFELYETLLGGNGSKGRIDGSYVRQALGRGFAIEERTGTNPFKTGFAGGSDSHSGTPASEEFNFPGAMGLADTVTNPKRLFEPVAAGSGEQKLIQSAAGLTGVWAEQNTRAAIFAAFKRKETFATSGSRIRVRLFAGWDFPGDLTATPDWVDKAAATGVAMGSDLLPQASGKGQAPRFAVQAIKDPDSGNLDRVQIVKVWYADGVAHEKVFDVVWAGDRKPDAKTGKLPAIGSTVDLKTAEYSNTIGVTELATLWTDPDFDAAVPAAYYARVLEIPTPRWTTIVAVKNGLPISDQVPPTIQEHAWTSPVFYRPAAREHG